MHGHSPNGGSGVLTPWYQKRGPGVAEGDPAWGLRHIQGSEFLTPPAHNDGWVMLTPSSNDPKIITPPSDARESWFQQRDGGEAMGRTPLRPTVPTDHISTSGVGGRRSTEATVIDSAQFSRYGSGHSPMLPEYTRTASPVGSIPPRAPPVLTSTALWGGAHAHPERPATVVAQSEPRPNFGAAGALHPLTGQPVGPGRKNPNGAHLSEALVVGAPRDARLMPHNGAHAAAYPHPAQLQAHQPQQPQPHPHFHRHHDPRSQSPPSVHSVGGDSAAALQRQLSQPPPPKPPPPGGIYAKPLQLPAGTIVGHSSLRTQRDNMAGATRRLDMMTVAGLLGTIDRFRERLKHSNTRHIEESRFFDAEFPSQPRLTAEEQALRGGMLLLLGSLFCLLFIETLCHADVDVGTRCSKVEDTFFYVYVIVLVVIVIVSCVQMFLHCGRGAFVSGSARTEARTRHTKLLYRKEKFHLLRRGSFMSNALEAPGSEYKGAPMVPDLGHLAAKPSVAWGPRPAPGDYSIFGAAMRRKHFDMDACFLNSASYGATPKEVRAAKNQWDVIIQQCPSGFLQYALPRRLDDVILRLSAFIGSRPEDTVLMTNANQATSVILKSLPWTVGDRILIFSVDYDATKLAMNWLHRRHGVEIVTLPVNLPVTDKALLAQVRKYLESCPKNQLPKLANFCHVTSKTAWIFPAKELTELFHEYNVPVIIDGAQAAGHLHIDVADIGADWYLGTVHKWLYSCQGVAFLVTLPGKKATTFPLNVSLYCFQSWKEEFSTFSMLDWPTWLTVDTAFDFIDNVCGGIDNVRGYIRQQAAQLTQLIDREWGTSPAQVDAGHHGAMPIFPLPGGEGLANQAAVGTMAFLLSKKVTAFLLCADFEGKSKVCIRCSCQIYTDLDDWMVMAKLVRSLNGKYGAMGVVAGMLGGGGGGGGGKGKAEGQGKKGKKGKEEDEMPDAAVLN